ncbi:uncharacterized protein [Nicotiana tomentosiformis]|uniref:uncharacterized protein n=1 Tax=Nicotiana tomentosiformis TaxID=4098 RepID=UPI00388C8693
MAAGSTLKKYSDNRGALLDSPPVSLKEDDEKRCEFPNSDLVDDDVNDKPDYDVYNKRSVGPVTKALNAFVTRKPELILELKQWVEGLGKDVAMMPPSGDEEVLGPKQVKERKRKYAPSSPVLEKKKPAKKSSPGGSSIMPPNSIRRLKDEPKEGEEELACVWANVIIQQSFELAEASVLHHEAFLRIREEHEAEVRNLTEKSDSYKLLSKKLRVDLAMDRDEHEELAEQVRQRLEQIGRLILQVDELLAKAEKFKKHMDILTSKKKVVQA